MLTVPGHPGRIILIMRWFVFVWLFVVPTQSLEGK